MDTEKNTQDFEKTKWMQRMADIIKDPQMLAKFEKAVGDWLANKGKNNATVKRADQAYRLFKSGQGKELLTPRNVLLLGAALLYLISPVDSIPDLVPFIGLLDDLGVLSLVLSAVIPAFIKNEIPQEQREELQQEALAIEQDLNATPNAEAEARIDDTPTEQETAPAPSADRSFSAAIRRLAAKFMPRAKK